MSGAGWAMVVLAGPVGGWRQAVEPLIGLPVGKVPDQVPNLLTPEIDNSNSLNVVSLI